VQSDDQDDVPVVVYFGLITISEGLRNNRLPDYSFIEPPYVDQTTARWPPTIIPTTSSPRAICSSEHNDDPLVRRAVALDLALIVGRARRDLRPRVAADVAVWRRLPLGVSGFNFDRLGVRVRAIVVPYVTGRLAYAPEHASIPPPPRQFIGPPDRNGHASASEGADDAAA
jgi:hypothetical protein